MKKIMIRKIISLVVILSLLGGMTVSVFAAWGFPANIDILVDGQSYTLNGYSVEGYDYYRLTDIAYVLRNANEKSFSIAEQNGRLELLKNQPFSANHTLLTGNDISLLQNTAVFTTQQFYIDGVKNTYTIAKVADEIYMRLADVAQLFDLAMVYANNTAIINTSMHFLTNLPEIAEEGYFDFLHGSIVGDLAGHIYYENKADEKAAIASTSKIMTYLLVMEAIDAGQISLNDAVSVSAEAARLSRTEDRELRDLMRGETIPLPQLLDVMLVCSSNEAATMLAEHVYPTEADFVARMNARAAELDLHTAEFYNAHGLPVYTPDLLSAKRQNRMSARDLYELSCYVLEKYPEILDITRKETVIAEGNNGYTFTGNTTNRLMFQVANIDGLKTGTTNRAGACQVGTMKGSDDSAASRYIAVVLGAEDNLERYWKTGMLLQYAAETASGRQTEVVLFSPSGSNASRAGKVEIAFTDRMDRTQGQLTLDGQAVTDFQWSGDNKYLSFSYAGFSYNTVHTVTLSGFVSEIGAVADSSLTFTTEQSGSSGSSGSGKGSSSLSPQTVTTSSQPGVYAPAVTAANGTATVSMDSNTVAKLATEAAKNGSGKIAIAPKVSGDMSKLTVTMPASALTSLVAETDAALIITSDLAEMNIPPQALRDIVSQAKGSASVSFGLEKGSVIVSIAADQRALTSLSGGITLSMPASGASAGTVAVRISNDGNQTILAKSTAGKGTLTARLEGSSRVDRLDNGKSFHDVASTHWAYEPITFVSARELLQGTGDNTFSADTGMTRGMLVTVLHRLENTAALDSTVSANTARFNDVDLSLWYGNAVSWASSNEIVSGIDAQTFAPNKEITRAELVTMIYRYSDYLDLDMSVSGNLNSFSDASDVQAWASSAMSWAVGSGLISGNEQGQLSPNAQATRAEVSSIIQRLITNMAK